MRSAHMFAVSAACTLYIALQRCMCCKYRVANRYRNPVQLQGPPVIWLASRSLLMYFAIVVCLYGFGHRSHELLVKGLSL